MILLVLAANNNVVKVGEARLKTILIYKLHHLPLKTGYSIGYPERQAGELIEIASNFKGCVRLVFFLEWHLMICTSKINGVEDSVLGDFVDRVAYSGQWESIWKCESVNCLSVVAR